MKSKHKDTTTATYGYQTPPTTQAQSDYDAWAHGTAFTQPDPSIGYNFGAARQHEADSFDDPWAQGAQMSPELRAARHYAATQQLDQAQGQAYREDAQQRRTGQGLALATSAAAHAPQLVQTGGTSQGYSTTPWGPALIGAVGQAAGGALS